MKEMVELVNSIMNNKNIDNATKTALMSYVQEHPTMTLTELKAYVATLIDDDNTTSNNSETDTAAAELQNYITSFMNNSSIDQGIKMSVSQYMTSHPNTTLAELKAFIKSLQDNSEEEN